MGDFKLTDKFKHEIRHNRYQKAHDIFFSVQTFEEQEKFRNILKRHFDSIPFTISNAITAISIFISVKDFISATFYIDDIHLHYPRQPDISYYSAKLNYELIFKDGEVKEIYLNRCIRYYVRCIKLIKRDNLTYCTSEYKNYIANSLYNLYAFVRCVLSDHDLGSSLLKRYCPDTDHSVLQTYMKDWDYPEILGKIQPITVCGIKSLLK